jgi:phage shock protein PspC (stress-responsive transcriptional regulator)
MPDLARLLLGSFATDAKEQTMQSEQGNLFTRDDTFFGVCQGLAEDFGIHPNFLRVALGGALFWDPAAAIAAYLAAGVVVLVSRLIVPEPKAATELEPSFEAAPDEAGALAKPKSVEAERVDCEPAALAA